MKKIGWFWLLCLVVFITTGFLVIGFQTFIDVRGINYFTFF